MRRTVFSLLLIVALVGSALFVPPALAASEECRVNTAGSMGGDTIVFVDRNGAPSQQWSDGGLGGMKVLNASGQSLFIILASEIEPATRAAQATPGSLIPIKEGPGSYGPMRLSVYALDDASRTLKFVVIGEDNQGKENTLSFSGCIAPECPPVTVQKAYDKLSPQAPAGSAEPVDPCGKTPAPTTDPCSVNNKIVTFRGC